MTKIVVPEGEFTFQQICEVNPQVKPMTVLKFVTEQVSIGKMQKNKTQVELDRQATYEPISTADEVPLQKAA